jgi:hypothetical protein
MRSSLLLGVLAAIGSALPASAADEVHWLGEDRYLIRYRERDVKNVAGALATAREKAAALCQLRGMQAYSFDETEVRRRLGAEFREISVDVFLFPELPEASSTDPAGSAAASDGASELPVQPPDGHTAPRTCERADQKALETIRKALRKSGDGG